MRDCTKLRTRRSEMQCSRLQHGNSSGKLSLRAARESAAICARWINVRIIKRVSRTRADGQREAACDAIRSKNRSRWKVRLRFSSLANEIRNPDNTRSAAAKFWTINSSWISQRHKIASSFTKQFQPHLEYEDLRRYRRGLKFLD